MLRSRTAEPTPLENLPRQEDFSDYRDVEGVKLPFTVVSRSPEGMNTARLEEVKVNVELPADVFSKPSS